MVAMMRMMMVVYVAGHSFSHLLFKAQREHLKEARRVGGELQANVRVPVNAVSARARTLLVKREPLCAGWTESDGWFDSYHGIKLLAYSSRLPCM